MRLGVDSPGVEPGKPGLSIRLSEPAEPTPKPSIAPQIRSGVQNVRGVIEKPAFSNAISQSARQAWIDAHGDAVSREVAVYLADHLTHIDQRTFERQLAETVGAFNKNIPKKYIVITNGVEKSTQWVYGLAQSQFAHPPEALVDFREVQKWLAKHPDVTDVVIIDDASYSGQQQEAMLTSLGDASRVNPVSAHLLYPYMTARAVILRDAISTPGVRSVGYPAAPIPSLNEYLDGEDRAYQTKLRDTLRRLYSIQTPEDADRIYLTYFDHKVPDGDSFFYVLRAGFVGDSDQRVPLIPETKEPYKAGYDQWVVSQMQNGRQPIPILSSNSASLWTSYRVWADGLTTRAQAGIDAVAKRVMKDWCSGGASLLPGRPSGGAVGLIGADDDVGKEKNENHEKRIGHSRTRQEFSGGNSSENHIRLLLSKNQKPISKDTIPNGTLTSKSSQTSLVSSANNPGVMSITPNQPDAKLINKPESPSNTISRENALIAVDGNTGGHLLSRIIRPVLLPLYQNATAIGAGFGTWSTSLPGGAARGSGFVSDIPEKERDDAQESKKLHIPIHQEIFETHDLLLSRLTFPAKKFEVQNGNNSKEHTHGKSSIDDVAHKLSFDHMVLRDVSSARIKNSIPEANAFATSILVPITLSRASEPGDMRRSPNQPAARLVNTSLTIDGRLSFIRPVYAADGPVGGGGCTAKPVIHALAAVAKELVEPPAVTIANLFESLGIFSSHRFVTISQGPKLKDQEQGRYVMHTPIIESPQEPSTRLSIIVPVAYEYDSGIWMRFLDSLVSQSSVPSTFEVLMLVNNTPEAVGTPIWTDNRKIISTVQYLNGTLTLEQLKQRLAEDPSGEGLSAYDIDVLARVRQRGIRLHIIDYTDGIVRNIGLLRDIGAQEAIRRFEKNSHGNSGVVAMMDVDAILPPDYVEKIVSYYDADPNAKTLFAFTGPLEFFYGNREAAESYGLEAGKMMRRYIDQLFIELIHVNPIIIPVDSPFIITRADTLRSVGGVPQIPRQEDFQLAERLYTAGEHIFVPDIILKKGDRQKALGYDASFRSVTSDRYDNVLIPLLLTFAAKLDNHTLKLDVLHEIFSQVFPSVSNENMYTFVKYLSDNPTITLRVMHSWLSKQFAAYREGGIPIEEAASLFVKFIPKVTSSEETVWIGKVYNAVERASKERQENATEAWRSLFTQWYEHSSSATLSEFLSSVGGPNALLITNNPWLQQEVENILNNSRNAEETVAKLREQSYSATLGISDQFQEMSTNIQTATVIIRAVFMQKSSRFPVLGRILSDTIRQPESKRVTGDRPLIIGDVAVPPYPLASDTDMGQSTSTGEGGGRRLK